MNGNKISPEGDTPRISETVRDAYWKLFPVDRMHVDTFHYHIAGADVDISKRDLRFDESLDFFYRFLYEERLLRHLVRKFVVKRRRVLDCGAGTGRNTLVLATLFENVDAFDVSDIFLVENSKRFGAYTHISFFKGTFEDLDVSGRQYDFIFVGGVFMCMNDIEIKLALEKIRSMLAPEGVLLVRDTLSKGALSEMAPNNIKIYRSEGAYRKLFDSLFVCGGVWNGANRNVFCSLFKRLPRSLREHKPVFRAFSFLVSLCIPCDIFFALMRRTRHTLASQLFFMFVPNQNS